MSIIQIKDVDNAEKTMVKTWEELKDAISSGVLRPEDTDKALSYTFLHVFNDLFVVNNQQKCFRRCLEEWEANDMCFVRCARWTSTVDSDYNRFIPNAKYIKSTNRFSPPGVEWLYLAWAENIADAKECARAECRIMHGEKAAFCEFKTINKNAQIVDLTIADHHTYESLNLLMDEFANNLTKKHVEMRKLPAEDELHAQCMRQIELWLVFTYARMLSSQIFIPVEGNREYEYAPFHCLANYFISLGYDGIAYTSTVSSKGKNIVLFDKSFAKPTGTIMVETC